MGNENSNEVVLKGGVIYRDILEIHPTKPYYTHNSPITFEVVLQPTTQMILQDISVKLRKEEVYLNKSSESNYLRNDNIDDFYIDDCLVSVYHIAGGYNLFFDDYKMNIEIYEKQIVGMSIEAL